MTAPPTSHRRPRPAPPAPPAGDIPLQPPPPLPRGGGQGIGQLTVMLPMMLMMGVMSFAYIGRSSGPMTIVFGALYVGVMVTMVVMTVGRGAAGRRNQLNEERRDYLRYLAGVRTQVRDNALRQRVALLSAHPDPQALIAAGDRVGERRPGDADFGHVRVGTGPQRLATALRAPQTAPVEDLDPVTSTSLRHFIRTYATVPDLPVALSVRAFARIHLVGARSVTLDLARALLAQLMTFHAPGELRIAICAPEQRRADWQWAKWSPHLRHTDRGVDGGPALLVAGTTAEIADLLADELAGRGPFDPQARPAVPHLVVVLDGVDPATARVGGDSAQGVTVLDLGAPGPRTDHELRLVVEADRFGIEGEDGIEFLGVPDRLSTASAEALARSLAPMSVPVRDRAGDALALHFGLPDLLGLGDPRDLDPAVRERVRRRQARLRIPIGIDDGGTPVHLDVKESAEGGMGPHGLVIGATGSGKSELLRTLVAGLAVTHSSETLNFVLVDFKGGATFAGLEVLPHTSAVITNLAGDLGLVDRMRDALQGELVRRQELLRRVGQASARDHERARAAGAALDPLPTLMVIIDEFSELLTSNPEFIDIFVTIGRLGRSLGVHLLLASQRLEEGRLRGLDSHLSYRIGLKTFSAAESRSVLGVPDAYTLPPVPGSGFLRHDTTSLVRFKAAYVSGALPPRAFAPTGGAGAPGRGVVRFDLSTPVPSAPVDAPPPAPAVPVDAAETVLGALVDGLLADVPAHQVWLPPLGEPPSLDQLVPELAVTPQRGLHPRDWPGLGALAVPVGLVDRPFEQRRDLLWADLSGAGGHAVVVGAPHSGKSTLVRTLVAALALTHTPAEVQVYAVDAGGGSLASLAGLPHVGGVAAVRDRERCVRLVAEVATVLDRREEEFVTLGVESVAAARQLRDPAGHRRFPDVFLVVDGWTTFRQDHEVLEERIVSVARRGLGYGVHVVITANRWMDVRPAVRDLLGTRFELRLGDPADSEVDRRAAVGVPDRTPGRGLTGTKHHFLAALPRVDGRGTGDDLAAGFDDLARRTADAWRGPVAPPVRMLPDLVDVAALAEPAAPGLLVPFGVAEADLGTVHLDFAADPHLLILGDTESGKSTALRTVVTALERRFTPEQVRMIVVDYRRSLLGAVTGGHLLGHAGNEAQLTAMTGEIEQGMRRRMPAADVTVEQLRDRSWWQGPELFLIVDDYDLVASTARNPLAPLVDLLPHARDIGLHVVVARRSGGAGRGLFDPLLARLRELASPGLVLSASAEEGMLLGVKPRTRPPGRGELVTRRGGAGLIQIATDVDPAAR